MAVGTLFAVGIIIIIIIIIIEVVALLYLVPIFIPLLLINELILYSSLGF